MKMMHGAARIWRSEMLVCGRCWFVGCWVWICVVSGGLSPAGIVPRVAVGYAQRYPRYVSMGLCFRQESSVCVDDSSGNGYYFVTLTVGIAARNPRLQVGLSLRGIVCVSFLCDGMRIIRGLGAR